MAVAQSYRLASPNVVSETVDGEAVILNLESGFYYSLDRTGSLLWDALHNGVSVDALGEAIADRFGLDPAAATAAVVGFADRLAEESLLRASSTPGLETVETLPDPTPDEAFTAPSLTRYEDIQELLLLDPIHEVDEDGWPQSPDGASRDGD